MSLTPLLEAPLPVQVHAFCAIAATLLGALVLFRRKGTPLHRLMGRTWVVLMLVVATSSLFINEIRLIGPFSPIHLLTLMTFGGVFMGVRYIRHGDVRRHRATMQTLYFGALILAGCFTLLPGRRMHDVVFGPDAGWTPSLLVIGLGLAATGIIWRRLAKTARPIPA